MFQIQFCDSFDSDKQGKGTASFVGKISNHLASPSDYLNSLLGKTSNAEGRIKVVIKDIVIVATFVYQYLSL